MRCPRNRPRARPVPPIDVHLPRREEKVALSPLLSEGIAANHAKNPPAGIHPNAGRVGKWRGIGGGSGFGEVVDFMMELVERRVGGHCRETMLGIRRFFLPLRGAARHYGRDRKQVHRWMESFGLRTRTAGDEE